MHVTGIDWTGVIAEDYEASQDFFIQKLGLSLQFEAKKHVISHFRFPSGQLFELHGPSNRERRFEKFRWFDGHALGFDVEDFELAYQEMLDRGVQFIHGIERWHAEAWTMFLGPENILLQIQSSGQSAQRSPEVTSEILGFSWAGMVVQDFEGAVRFFSEIMAMPLAQLDNRNTLAHYRLSDGFLLEIIGSNHPRQKILKHITVGFEVNNVLDMQNKLSQKGVPFIGDIEVSAEGYEFAFFNGPDNTQYALWKRAG